MEQLNNFINAALFFADLLIALKIYFIIRHKRRPRLDRILAFIEDVICPVAIVWLLSAYILIFNN